MGKWSEIAQQTGEPESKWRSMAQQSEPQPAPVEDQMQMPPQGFVGSLSQEGDAFSGVGESIKNIPKSGFEFGKNTIRPLTHPKETAGAMADLALGVLEKFPGGKYLTSGPDYDISGQSNEREEAVDATMEFFSGRYGSFEKFQETMKSDPVGVIADLAGVLSGGGAGVKAFGNVAKVNAIQKAGATLSKIGAFADPIGAISALGQAGLKGIIPKGKASRLYEGAVKLRTTLIEGGDKARTRILNTALENQIMPTYKGLIKLGDQVEVLNVKIAKEIDKAVDTGNRISVDRLLSGFAEMKKNSRITGGAKPIDAQNTIKNIKKQIQEANSKTEIVEITELVPSTILDEKGSPYRIKKAVKKEVKVPLDLSPAEAQKLKQSIYRSIEGYYSQINNSTISVKAQKLVARNAKEAIETIVPEIKQLNKMDGDLLALKKEIERAVPRIANRDLLSLGTTAKAAGGGAVLGKWGLAAGLAAGMLDSQPVIKARLALIVHKLEKRGVKVNKTLALSRLTSFQSGRLSDEIIENRDE